MARRKTKRMNEDLFKQVKLLQEAKLSKVAIKDITGRGNTTQKYIEQAADFGEYQATVKEANDKYKQQREAVAPEVPQIAVHEEVLREIRITQITSTVEGYRISARTYTTKVYGLGEDNKLYYWDTGATAWRLEQ